MGMMTVGSLFSGIGGLDLGLERAGMNVRWQVERDPWCQEILTKHWPNTTRWADIESVVTDCLESVNVVCGGFPCQPFSHASNVRKGLKDSRWMWPEFVRVLDAVRPQYVIIENVPGLRKMGLRNVLGGLASLGYDAEWQGITAEAVGAPQIRQRLFIVAYTGHHVETKRGEHENAEREGVVWENGARRGSFNNRERCNAPSRQPSPSPVIFTHPPVCQSTWMERCIPRVAHGLSGSMDETRLAMLGNAVVPAVAEYVGELVIAHHSLHSMEEDTQWD